MNRENINIVTDLSNTLVKQEPLYDDALALVSREYFDGAVELCMNLGEYGNPFPTHIRTVLEHPSVAAYVQSTLQGLSTQELSVQLINRFIRPFLVKGFLSSQPEAIKGLESFINYTDQDNVQAGIVTGDLRAVAEVLLANNTYKDISSVFPIMTCGDDAGVQTRTDQIHATYEGVAKGTSGEKTVFIDDSSNGILCMREYARERGLKALVIGVETGSSASEKLIGQGANIVLRDIDRVAEFLHQYQK